MTEKRFYNLKNDFVFHVAFQECNPALRKFVAALLEIDEGDIHSCEVMNPITEGDNINSKDIVMDLLLKLNNSNLINMEMQIRKYSYLPARFLFYWARTYNTLSRGDDYSRLARTYQISILDHVLFEDDPCFFAKYQLINTDTGHIFSDYIDLRILSLPLVVQAKPGEEALVHWTRILNAQCFEELITLADGQEELIMLAEKVNEINNVPWYLSAAEGRADVEWQKSQCYQDGITKGITEGIREGSVAQKAIDEKIIAEKDALISQKDISLNERNDQINKMQLEIERLQALLAKSKD